MICPLCQKPILFAWFTGPMIAPPDRCQCPTVTVTIALVSSDSTTAITPLSRTSSSSSSAGRTPVPQAFYDAFEEDES